MPLIKENEHDYRYEDEIKCPFCDYINQDSWEYNFKYTDEEKEITCGNCNEEFLVTADIKITYSSSFIENK